MEPTIVSRKTIAVLSVQARLTNIDEGVPEMWEQRFTSDHDCIVVLRTDKFYHGCAFSTDRLGTCGYLAGMAVPALAAGSDGLTLREVLGGFCAKVERTAVRRTVFLTSLRKSGCRRQSTKETSRDLFSTATRQLRCPAIPKSISVSRS